jgi:exodeoxyribonuclease-5
MELTRDQENALKIAVERYKDKEAYTVIAGYAGTGKTTLVKFIIEALDIPEDKVVYIAYTGRASLVLKNKGCENAITAHKLLYHAKEKPDGTYEFKPKRQLDMNYDLIVLDEASMLPDDMWELLLTHRVHVLALGDIGQLPAIEGDSGILERPHAVLNEVVRQALESPIIRLSMDIRSGKWLEYGGPKECRIMTPEQVTDGLLIGADQVICGKNVTRHCLNEQIRKIKFQDEYKPEPMNGDKIVCLQNQWMVLGSNMEPLVNGMLGEVTNITFSDSKLYKPKMVADFISDNDGLYGQIPMDYKIFTEKESTINKDNWKNYPKNQRAYEFDYGYAITCHKSQGSEFDKVIVYDEWLGDREQHQRWLYTAVTRASKMLVIVK